MKRLSGLLLACIMGPAMAGSEHVNDVEYQKAINILVPVMSGVIKAVETANTAADEVDQIKGADNTVTFCNTLFESTPDCTASTGEQWIFTDGLEKLMNRSQQVYNCATNATCGQADRIRGLRRQTNELATVATARDTNDALVSKLKEKYVRMFSTMVSSGRILLETLLNSDLTNKVFNEIEGVKTSAQLCDQLFAPHETRDCTVGGGTDREINRTQDVMDASDAMDTLFDAANDVVVSTSDRLKAMRQFVEGR